ncbi:hypothetical protein VCR1J2_240108 [Vibrio coralliirubri]|nr:hypothetical protein VCR1J2_240108 [Vibrio coralliirubri]
MIGLQLIEQHSLKFPVPLIIEHCVEYEIKRDP